MDRIIVCRNRFCHFKKAFIRILSKKNLDWDSDEECSSDEEDWKRKKIGRCSRVKCMMYNVRM